MKKVLIPLLLLTAALLAGCADMPSEWYGISKAVKADSSVRQ